MKTIQIFSIMFMIVMATAPTKPSSYIDLVKKMVDEAITAGARSHDARDFSQDQFSFGFQNPYCADGIDCRSKYVQVNLNSSSGLVSCSGILITKYLVLTNRHCAKKIVSKANQKFSGNAISIVLPYKRKNTGPIDIVPVQNVVLISPEEIANPINSPDWAILLLDSNFPAPSDIKAPKLNRDGIQNGKTYYIYGSLPRNAVNYRLPSLGFGTRSKDVFASGLGNDLSMHSRFG